MAEYTVLSDWLTVPHFLVKISFLLFRMMFFQCCFAGPGLAIRVICAEEPYVCKDFPETNNILKIVADFSASVKKVRKCKILILGDGSVVTCSEV